MCRVISLSKLDRKTRDFALSFGGNGIIPVPREEQQRLRNIVEKEQETAWEQLVEREPLIEDGGLW